MPLLRATHAMTKEELEELQKLEGPVLSLEPKPLVDMTDAELEEFVQRVRDCSTNYQTLLAHNRLRDDDKPDANADLFE